MSFDRYFQEQMNDPETKKAYDEARAEIDSAKFAGAPLIAAVIIMIVAAIIKEFML